MTIKQINTIFSDTTHNILPHAKTAYDEFIRLCWVCSDETDFHGKAKEQIQFFRNQGYPEDIIETAYIYIYMKYGYEGYRKFPLPRAQVYFQREINMGKGEWLLPVSRNNHTLTVLLYRYNTFMPVYLHLLSFFYDRVNRKSNPTVSGLCHGSSPIFEEFLSTSKLVKTLSMMASKH